MPIIPSSACAEGQGSAGGLYKIQTEFQHAGKCAGESYTGGGGQLQECAGADAHGENDTDIGPSARKNGNLRKNNKCNSNVTQKVYILMCKL